MGRTARRRKKRKAENHLNFNEFQQFQNWISLQGWRQTLKMKLKWFPDTGRGLMAMKNINSGEVIVRVPPHLLITAKTVSQSQIGEIFSSAGVKLPLQLVMAAFVLLEKHLDSASFWKEYISVLPSTFTSPLFCTPEELALFPNFIYDKVVSTKALIKEMFNSLKSVIGNSPCSHCPILLRDIFSEKAFFWAWFAVNSRVVYVKPSVNPLQPIPLSDENSFALAPYLDMLNHSNSAKVIASFSIESGYEIQTLVPFKKHEQVFIHYGDLDNLKLFFDYGFILSENEHDAFPLTTSDIVDRIPDALSAERNLSLLIEHSSTFLKSLYCTSEGLSWNAKALIYLLCQPTHYNLRNIMINIYDGTFEKKCPLINKISKSIITCKVKELENAMNKIIGFKNSTILFIGLELIQSYLILLSKCLTTLLNSEIPISHET